MSELFYIYGVPCLLAFAACWGFCVIFNIHGSGIWICCAGGAVSWLVFLVMDTLLGSDMGAGFCAGVMVSLWAEVMSRIRKCPVTGYLIVAFFPLVPGGGIYYAMEHALRGETQAFVDTLMHTLGFSGVLALGVLVVSSVVRMWSLLQQKKRAKG